MDYKKKYEEAIERLKQWDREHPDGYAISDRDEFIFPELKEIEGGKVRKWLINLLRTMQFHQCDEDAGMPNKALSWIEKQGDQKPWSEEDEKMLNQVIEDIVKLAGPYVCYHKDVDWLKSLKDRVLPQPKQEWSEKDKERIEQICDDLKSGMINFYANKVVKGLHYEEIIESNIEWLKELGGRIAMQPKQERSEEDEKLINSVIELIDNGALDRDEKDYFIEKLKSLIPQSTWKPSKDI